MKQITLAIIGGHLATAYALAELASHDERVKAVVFIGRKHIFEREAGISEREIMRPVVSSVYEVDIPRLTIPHIAQVLKALWNCYFLLKREHPDVLVGFGSYVSIPPALAGFCLGIPLVIHEQTHEVKGANKFLAKIAAAVCVTYSDTKGMKSGDAQYHVTGLPLRASVRVSPAHSSFASHGNRPILYITGGTSGASSMNRLLFPIVSSLVDTWMVIHQTGEDSYRDAEQVKASLPIDQQAYYCIQPYMLSDDAGWLFHHASGIIARSGANTVYELALHPVPSILIPLPWSSGDEQKKNAEWLAKQRKIRIIDQEHTDASSLLLTAISELGHTSWTKRGKPLVSENGAQSLLDIAIQQVR